MKTAKHLTRFSGAALQWIRKVHLPAMMLLVVLCVQQNNFAYYSPLAGNTPNAEWILDKTVDNVDFYYMFGECEGKKVVFLKFNNRNKGNVKVSWKEVFSTQFEKKREGFRGEKQLVLSSGETSQSTCTNVQVEQCIVLPSEVSATYLAEITSFSFAGVRVSKAA